MTDIIPTSDSPFDDPRQDVEQWLKQAGDWIEVTRDLRARTLEQARAVREAQSRRQGAHMLGIAALLVCFLSPPVHSPQSTASPLAESVWSAEAVQQSARFYEQSESQSGWGMVEAYQQLRRQQSRAIGATF